MALLSMRDVSVGFGGPPLLESVQLQIERGERIGLLGRNGAGKSSLMRLINGEMQPEAGELTRGQGVRIGRLIQEVPRGESGPVFDVVAGGLLDDDGTAPADPAGQSRRVHELLDGDGGWEHRRQVEKVVSQMTLDPQAEFATLSSGMKRRVLLARSLVRDPDLLLLDEPTNHLDIDSIIFLEDFLARYDGTLLFVTHDRAFLQKLATRIIEIDRGKLFDWTCDYATFVERKDAALEAEARQEALFDKKLAQEEVWIRQGIKARRTRNEGRVRALKKLREERQSRRERVGTVRMQAQDAERSGRLVIEAKGLRFGYDDRPVVRDFSTTLMRGDKIGIIGPNGSGKTTLLRLLLGDLTPDAGTVRHGTNLQVAYFDQLRERIDEEKTVQQNVCDNGDTISINGGQRHVIGYLQDFLFSPERSRSPARYLSGGERNRLMLARLFTRPANVLVLDEPTNDLDTETLELLEGLLVEYSGTLLLVSHDRAFLNNVVTSTLVFEGDGRVREYDGGYDDWQRQRKAQLAETRADRPEPVRTAARQERPRKLSFKEQRELDALPQQIELLEAEQQQLHETMADPAFYRQEGTEIADATARLTALEEELTRVYQRWEELEERR